jgi:hypothetical protein
MMGGRSTRKKVVGENDSILKDKEEYAINSSSPVRQPYFSNCATEKITWHSQPGKFQ